MTPEQIELLQTMADEAHNDATNRLFKICEELRKDQDRCLELGGGLGDWTPVLTREELCALAWVDKVFQFMSLVDDLRNSTEPQPKEGKIAGAPLKDWKPQ